MFCSSDLRLFSSSTQNGVTLAAVRKYYMIQIKINERSFGY